MGLGADSTTTNLISSVQKVYKASGSNLKFMTQQEGFLDIMVPNPVPYVVHNVFNLVSWSSM